MRDIYRAQRDHDPALSALLRGERPAPDDIERVKRAHPDLTLRAAANASWEAIPMLVELGFGLEGRDGRTPLHHAAAEGHLELIRLLIDAGADLDARDPIYKAKPYRWATFFGRDEAAALLREAHTSTGS